MWALGKGANGNEPEERKRASNESNLPLDSLEEVVTGLLCAAMVVLFAPGLFGFFKRIVKGKDPTQKSEAYELKDELSKFTRELQERDSTRDSKVNELKAEFSKLKSGLEERVSILEKKQRQQKIEIGELQSLLYPVVRGSVFDDFMIWVLEAELRYGKQSEDLLLDCDNSSDSPVTEAEPLDFRNAFAKYVTGLKDRPDELAWLTRLANEHGGVKHTPKNFMDVLTFCMEKANRQDTSTALPSIGEGNRAAPRVTAEMVERSIRNYTGDVECKAKLEALLKIANPAIAL